MLLPHRCAVVFWRDFVRRVAVPLLTVGLLCAACFGDDGDAPASMVAPGTPHPSAPTLAPTPPPADPTLGDRLRYEGDFEGAIGVYGEIAREEEGTERQAALLAQAQLLQRAGRFAEARDALLAYLADAGAAADGTAARFLLASVLDGLGDAQGALASYELYIASGGVASPFAEIERATMLARLGRADEAQAAGELALASDLAASSKGSFMLRMGWAFEDAGATAPALAWYERAAAAAAPDGDVAAALARMAGIKQELGDATWADAYARVVRSYPASGAATDALEALDAASVPVSDYERGLVHYRAFRDGPARAAFDRAIAAGDRAAEASYYVGAIDEREGSAEAAMDAYERAHDLDPASPQSDDALWWRGRLLEGAGRYADAGATYARLVTEYPASVWATDANFHRGMVLYRSGDAAGAAYAWGVIARATTDAEERDKVRFWQGRAGRDAGTAGAEDALRQLMRDDPSNFYALRAEVLLGENDDDVKDVTVQARDVDWGAVAAYLDEAYGVDIDAIAPPPADDGQWALATELRAVGLRAQADGVDQALIGAAASDVARLYRVTRRFEEAGQTSAAARAATTLTKRLHDDGKPEPPDDLLRVAYPPAFPDLVQEAADEHDVPSLLLLSLVRQESFYDPDAGSSAGALGLTQVIEGTGRAIAGDLGVSAFTAADLYRPRLSLRFGASYLADQIAQFDGNEYHALAAYNGGPGASSNAMRSAGDDVDLFIEDLEFDETRLYVKLVMENYGRYRQLYEGTGRPTLPQ